MICFSDRKLIQYRCNGKEVELRNMLLKYYENIEEDAIIVIYNKAGNVVGWTSYQNLLEKEEYIISICFYADISFWDNIEKNPQIIPTGGFY